MVINTDLLDFVSVRDLLGPGAPVLLIPDFQRPYSWTPAIAAQLFTDILEALHTRPEHPYIMGTIILLKRQQDTHFEVVDGQQRLLTLHLLQNLVRGGTVPADESARSPIHLVSREIGRRVRRLSDEELHRFQDFLDEQAQVLRIVTDDEDEAFQFFDSQNFRGKALRPHDLLKAYHLREMAGATTAEQRAVVEQWEEADENALDQLFGTYLARIHWWSRNVPARAFTANDIDLFKGIGRSTRRLPASEYHRAAKTILPGLREWASIDDGATSRDMKRAEHQLDVPIAAGRSFFDYASFMLAEAIRLDKALFEPEPRGQPPAPDLSMFRDNARYRFCRELYVAAALYWTNKYSEADFAEVRGLLFRWAYALRLDYERLGWRSTNNYARGQGGTLNLFAAIRDNLDPRGVPLESVVIPQEPTSRNTQDRQLASLLKAGDAR